MHFSYVWYYINTSWEVQDDPHSQDYFEMRLKLWLWFRWETWQPRKSLSPPGVGSGQPSWKRRLKREKVQERLSHAAEPISSNPAGTPPTFTWCGSRNSLVQTEEPRRQTTQPLGCKPSVFPLWEGWDPRNIRQAFTACSYFQVWGNACVRRDSVREGDIGGR